MSSIHLVFGRPGRRWAVNLGCNVGSQCKAVMVHSGSVRLNMRRAYLHFRRRKLLIQSSRFSRRMRSSASCVLLLIQSAHGSMSLAVGMSSRGASRSGSETVLSTSFSVVEPLSSVLWTGGRRVGDGVDDVVDGCVVWSGVDARWIVLAVCPRRGVCRIIRSICLCVLRSRFSSSSVRVHASAP